MKKLLAILLCSVLVGCEVKPEPTLSTEVSSFFQSHPEFGKPQSEKDVDNWAKGSRKQVSTTKYGNLLVYLQDGKVVSVYDMNAERRKIYGK